MQDAPPADALLLRAYPDERQRAHAIRLLGWIACRMGASGRLDWWTISATVPPRQVRTARRIVVAAILVVTVAVASAVTSSVWPVLLSAFMGFVAFIRRPRTGAAERQKPPRAIVPHWPRRRELAHLLTYTILTLGLGFGPILVSIWEVSSAKDPAATAVGTYRGDRRAALIDGLAFAPIGALVGVILLFPAYGSAGFPVGLVLITLGAAACRAIMWRSSYSRLKLAELVLAVKWRGRASFLRGLEDAANRGVVRQAGVGYEFTNDGLRDQLAALGPSTGQQRPCRSVRAAWIAKLGRKTLRQAETGKPSHRMASAIAAGLTKARVNRITFDFAGGAAIATLAGFLLSAIPGRASLADQILGSLFFPLLALVAGTVVARALLSVTAAAAARLARSSVAGLSRPARLGAAVAAVAVVAVLVVEAGTFLADGLAFLLPAAFVSASGLWACVLALRRWHASPRTWLRTVPDQVAAAASAAALLVAADRGLLTTQWATVLLFPVATAGSLKLWAVLREAKRLVIRAGADIVLSLLLGGELVLFLVWLANVLGMSRSEVAWIRAELGSAGSYASVYDGGRLWAALYATLALASVVFALYPVRLKSVITWVDRLNLAALAGAAQRVVTGLYIGLLALVLVGVAGPTALTSVLQRQLRATYTVALQRQLQTEAEISADNEIRELTPPSSLAILVYLFEEIHQDAHPGSHGATRAEDALAYQIGQDQAAALDLSGPVSPVAADVNEPTQDLSTAAAQTQGEENASDQASEHLKTAFELTVTALTNAIPIPDVGKNEVAQVVAQYLSGLVDDSKVTETFEAWLERIPHGKKPPSGEVLAIPDPSNLDTAAGNALDHESAVQDVTVLPGSINKILLDPSAPASEVDKAIIDEAIDSASQAQQIQETGTCSGCISIDDDGGSHDHNDDPDSEHVDGD